MIEEVGSKLKLSHSSITSFEKNSFKFLDSTVKSIRRKASNALIIFKNKRKKRTLGSYPCIFAKFVFVFCIFTQSVKHFWHQLFDCKKGSVWLNDWVFVYELSGSRFKSLFSQFKELFIRRELDWCVFIRESYCKDKLH